MSLSARCLFPPAEVNIRIGQSSAAHAAFALRLKARPSGILIFEATMRSPCYGPVTRSLPWGDSVDRLQSFSFHHLCYPNYGALTSTPAGLSPAEHASLHWTHNRTGRSPASGSRTRLHAFAFACNAVCSF